MKRRLALLICAAVILPGTHVRAHASSPARARVAGSTTATEERKEATAALEQAARRKTNLTARLPLADEQDATLRAVDYADPLGGDRVPNYLRALARHTDAAPQFARLVRAVLFEGTVAPHTKMAMGLRIAQVLDSPYTAAHARRYLRSDEQGRKSLDELLRAGAARLAPAEQIALSYAESLTRGIHDVSDADFRRVRAYYDDSQIVELTMTVCFFNYFARLNEALALPVEPWALDEARPAAQTAATAKSAAAPVARVALISDEEIAATSSVAAAAKEPQKPAAGLGLGVANSQRAMLRAPALALAWRAYGAAVRERSSIDRSLQLHVSFAVSAANGCRYCTLHQVLGLRRLGIEPAKLISMRKDDSALTARERVAVAFARRLTREPAGVTDADFDSLKTEFGERGALEVALQTCAFNFMNRFTDGLRLPSEDEAIRVYQEVYGS